MKYILNKAMLLVATTATILLLSCGKDFKDDIDKLNGQYTTIDQRVSTLETQVNTMNTQLTQLSVLATAVESGFYITQVKTIADGYELTLSNGHIIILQNGPDNRLTPMPAISMTEIDGFFYWTLNGLLLTDENGKPIRSTGKAPIVRYDFTKFVWMVSIDGGVTFQNIDIMASVIINDEVLMQIINSYVRQHSTTIISQEVLFQIISTYIQQNYARLFSVQLLNQVVATHIREHYTRIFSYELLEKIFTQYNFSYITSNIKVEELVDAIITFIREHQEIFLNNDVLFEIMSAYMEENKTDIFTDQLLLQVINNFVENNTNFIDIDLLTLVVSNYIDTHQDELFNSETVGKLIMDYVAKYYTEIFSQDILIRLVSTYVTQNKTTIFNKTLIEEVISNYVKNNYTTIFKQETISEIINNYLKKNTTTVFNREVLIDVISTYFSKNYNLFIDNTVITKAVNEYINKHKTTIISAEVVSHIVSRYLEQYYSEVFTYDMLTQVINNYFSKNMQVITQHTTQGNSLVTAINTDDDICTITLAGGKTIQLVVYDAMARLRDRVQSVVVVPNANGHIGSDVWHKDIRATYAVAPTSMASVIAEKYLTHDMTIELIATDGNGNIFTIDVSQVNAAEGKLSVIAWPSSTVAAVALHIKENKPAGTDITTEFTPIEYEGQQEQPMCPDNKHPHMINLGLPSGIMWACCNVGASKPEDYGDYYAWGETRTKDIYSWQSYEYRNKSGNNGNYVNIGSNIAGTKYDAATAKWGKAWQMPSREQFMELKDKCTSTWTIHNGINGRIFTGPNGRRIFLPAAGYSCVSYTYGYSAILNDAGENGYYWASTINLEVDYASDCLNIKWFSVGDPHFGLREYGRSIRPISDKR